MKRKLIVNVFLIFLVSCQTKPDKFTADKWYEQTKTEILKQSNLTPDSIIIVNPKWDSLRTEKKSFNNGVVFFSEIFENGIKRGETYFSVDHIFELRREICQNNLISFEGIFFNGGSYGVSTWKYCNGKTEQEGIRFNNKHIGVWKEYDETGKMTNQSDYQQMELLDSLPLIDKK